MTLVIACSRPEKPFIVPGLDEVRSVKVCHLKDPLVLWEREIRDPRQINKLLVHFRKHNTGYRLHTRLDDLLYSRPLDYTIVFKGEEGSRSPLILHIGSNWMSSYWIGGYDFKRGQPTLYRSRSLRKSELKEILAIVKEDHEPKGPGSSAR
ncbi:MAG TPA: hypothetical protein VJ725_16135 [Thermoanaerobaculia bacterium]|nr:hypothetical protein [Thermoanaerobaculia bacterium]